MKNLKKKIVALGLALSAMASSVMSVSASAATIDSWPAFYVPYSGTCYASAGSVRVNGLQWSASQLEQIKGQEINYPNTYVPLSMELEFRTVNSAGDAVDTHSIWDSKDGALLTNMPNASFEFQWYDDEDVTFVVLADGLMADKSYYAKQNMTPTTSSSGSNKYYIFECELGDWYLIDSWPVRYSQRPTLVPFGITTNIRG